MSWLFKKKKLPSEIKLEQEVKEARWKGYRQGKLERARAEGKREGKTTRTERFLSSMEGVGRVSKQLDAFGSSMLGDLSALGGSEPRRRTQKKRKIKKVIYYR